MMRCATASGTSVSPLAAAAQRRAGEHLADVDVQVGVVVRLHRHQLVVFLGVGEQVAQVGGDGHVVERHRGRGVGAARADGYT